jgi:hypothetical protein
VEGVETGVAIIGAYRGQHAGGLVGGIHVAPRASMATKRKSAKSRPKSTAKRGSGKRTLPKARNATFFARRTASGRFREMDGQGRSLAADRRRKAKRRTKSGYADRGDRAASPARSPAGRKQSAPAASPSVSPGH